MTLAYGCTDCTLQIQQWRKADEQDRSICLPSFMVAQWVDEDGRLCAEWDRVVEVANRAH